MGRQRHGKGLEPTERRVFLVSAEVLHASNSVVLVDVKAAMPYTLTPALPRGYKRVRVNSVVLILVTPASSLLV